MNGGCALLLPHAVGVGAGVGQREIPAGSGWSMAEGGVPGVGAGPEVKEVVERSARADVRAGSRVVSGSKDGTSSNPLSDPKMSCIETEGLLVRGGTGGAELGFALGVTGSAGWGCMMASP